MAKRPILITILAILVVLAGLAAISTSLQVFLASDGGEWAPLSLFGILLGLIYFLLGWGVLKGWGWVWWAIVTVSVLQILNVLYNTFTGDEITDWTTTIIDILVAITIPIIILLYMNSSKVKNWFKIGKKAAPPATP
jgi:hypothetical protein